MTAYLQKLIFKQKMSKGTLYAEKDYSLANNTRMSKTTLKLKRPSKFSVLGQCWWADKNLLWSKYMMTKSYKKHPSMLLMFRNIKKCVFNKLLICHIKKKILTCWPVMTRILSLTLAPLFSITSSQKPNLYERKCSLSMLSLLAMTPGLRDFIWSGGSKAHAVWCNDHDRRAR